MGQLRAAGRDQRADDGSDREHGRQQPVPGTTGVERAGAHGRHGDLVVAPETAEDEREREGDQHDRLAQQVSEPGAYAPVGSGRLRRAGEGVPLSRPHQQQRDDQGEEAHGIGGEQRPRAGGGDQRSAQAHAEDAAACVDQ
jgi:hypothetical protein